MGVVVERPAWYLELMNRLRKLVRMDRKAMRLSLKTKHLIGRIIDRALQEQDIKTVFGSVDKFMRALSQDLNISVSELYAYLRFARLFPDFEKFYETYSGAGVVLSWRQIEKAILYGQRYSINSQSSNAVMSTSNTINTIMGTDIHTQTPAKITEIMPEITTQHKHTWTCSLCGHEYDENTQKKIITITLCPKCHAEYEVWRVEHLDKQG